MQGFPSSQLKGLPEWQTPPPQLSLSLHTLLSEQLAVLALWVQPEALAHASSVQGLPSSQLTALPGTQLPSAQPSPAVHALLSVQF